MTRRKLALCTIFQDEARYLREWIEFHRLQGVEHFFLYDNRSHDEPGRVLKPWLDAGVVTLRQWPLAFEDKAQIKASNSDAILPGFQQNFERWLTATI